MRFWRFLDYHDGNGNNLARIWYEAQAAEVRAEIKWAVAEVEATEDLDTNPTFNRLKNQHVGLFTLRISPEINRKKLQIRTVGFWSLSRGELILAGGFQKSGRITIPPGACDDVLNIQLGYFRDGHGTVYDHSF